MTLYDLERPKRTLAEKIVLRSPPEKFEGIWKHANAMSGEMYIGQ